MTHSRFSCLLGTACFLAFASCAKSPDVSPLHPIIIQLNWLHDPTFAGEYFAAQRDTSIRLRAGGPGITPMAEVLGGRADVAIVGADVFLATLAGKSPEARDLVCFYVDLQRNPVGWVVHPDAAMRAGYRSDMMADGKARNAWLFEAFRRKTLQAGDKRGTETTAIWLLWKTLHRLGSDVTVTPVGFDAAIVLTAPRLAYPVYLNEEPYKLAAQIGRPVIVFDPADDGVRIYGNVLVTTTRVINRPDRPIERLVAALNSGWIDVKSNPDSAVKVVAKYYTGVSSSTLQREIEKTVAFAFFGTAQPGVVDTTRTGLWNTTLVAMRSAGIVSSQLTVDSVRAHLMQAHD